MLLWPRRWNARFPASLLGIILAGGLNALLQWPVAVIGEIPQTLFLQQRLALANIPWGNLQANQELVAQGIGNMIIPFFGGVPATAAIARTSVGIKSGGQTRLVSIIHALALLGSMFILAPVMSRIPLAALAGVLVVTAYRMNEWESIQYIFHHRLKTAIITFTITLVATIALDLTQAILIGAFLSGAVFLNQSASMDIRLQDVDPEKLRQRGIHNAGRCRHVRVAYLTGPLFFAATGNFNEAFASLKDIHVLILSMRGVSLIDTSGMQAMLALHEKLHHAGSRLMLSGVPDNVRQMMERGGLVKVIGSENYFWSSDQAIVAAEQQPCRYCAASSAD